jgi:hypothetical protein
MGYRGWNFESAYMDFFWTNVFEYFKDRRMAGVFFGTLLALVGLIIAGVIVYQILGDKVVYLLPVAAAFFLISAARAILRARARRRNRYKSSPLSRDELKKARSKLMRARP